MSGERGNLLLRTLDRHLGIPLVRAAGLCHRRRPLPARIDSIGALCLGCIGDMVLFSATLADLAHKHPGCRQVIFASHGNADIARMAPSAAEVVVLPVSSPLAAAKIIRDHGRFDGWIDASQWPRLGALLSLAARANFKAGFSSPGQHRHHIYDAVVKHSSRRHELDNFHALAATFGVVERSLPLLAPPLETDAELAERLDLGRTFAVLHLFPGGFRSHMKQWPLERWAETAHGLLARGLDLVLSGGPADAEGNETLLRGIGSPNRAHNLAGVRIGPMARLLQRAALVISVNTGVMHLAAAVGAPVISLNGPTSVERWGALTRPERGIALRSPRSCAPCLHLGFEYACGESLCMRDIRVEDVLSAVDALLAGGPA